MKSVRVVLAVVALLALPFGAVAAQGRAKPKPRTASEVSGECKDQQAATLSRANDAGHDPYGLDKKCPDAPPSGGGGGGGGGGQDLPPTGTNHVDGLVYEELDGNSGFNPFAGDMPIANVPVQLSWNGQVIASAVSDANGAFSFPGLGGTALNPATFVVCVSGPSGFGQIVPDPSAPGAPCSGAGYTIIFNNDFETGFPAQFGYLMQ